METELQRFERLCKEVHIPITTLNFHVTQPEIYKLFKVIVKDCEAESKNNYVNEPIKEKSLDNVSKDVLRRLKRYSSAGLTMSELAKLCDNSLPKIKSVCVKLKKDGLIVYVGMRSKEMVVKLK